MSDVELYKYDESRLVEVEDDTVSFEKVGDKVAGILLSKESFTKNDSENFVYTLEIGKGVQKQIFGTTDLNKKMGKVMPGEDFVEIEYRKDVRTSKGNDLKIFKVRKEKAVDIIKTN